MNTRIESLDRQSPEAIEREIAATRESLDSKLAEIESRLNPRVHLDRWQARLDPRGHMDLVAAGLVLAGSIMAVTGLLRSRESATVDDAAADELMDELDEVVLDEIIVCE
jgi:hypothetical protein